MRIVFISFVGLLLFLAQAFAEPQQKLTKQQKAELISYTIKLRHLISAAMHRVPHPHAGAADVEFHIAPNGKAKIVLIDTDSEILREFIRVNFGTTRFPRPPRWSEKPFQVIVPLKFWP